MTTHFDLVSKDYYKEELDYQKVIDSKENARNLKTEIAAEVIGKSITLRLPEELRNATITGKVHFYSVINADRDHNIPLSFDQNGEQHIAADKFIPGNYTAKITYSNAGKGFYTEIPVSL